MLTFEELYDGYATQVYRFAFWLAGDGSEAEDITSDTFIRAWANHSAIRTQTLKAYLMAIARNVYLQQQRRRKRQVALEDIHPDPGPQPEKLAEVGLEITRVQRILRSLSENDRAAFILRVEHQLPYAEIARVLELSVNAAKVKVHRVRKKLLASTVEREIEE